MLSRKLPKDSRARRATVLVVIAVVAAACGASHGNGTLVSPCGHGSATGATANGVTNTSITIGYGDDAGYAAAPGLDKEMSDAVKPMIKWCNDQGGINGRKVIGNYYDAK